MSIFDWCSRRAGGLSMIALVFLCYWVISREASATLQRHSGSEELPITPAGSSHAGVWSKIFAYYSLFVHFLVALFPIRACWALWEITNGLKLEARKQVFEECKKLRLSRRNSTASLSSSETLTSESNVRQSMSDTISCIDAEKNAEETETETEGPLGRVVHAIVIPNYKEEKDTLRETLEVLASHPHAQTCYDIYLAMEVRENGAEAKALALAQEFLGRFRSIDYTLHPPDIPGEAAGKGSNMAWAARKLSVKYPIELRQDVIVTGLDADSHLSLKYFAHLTSMHLQYPETASTTLYAVPIVFDRNAHNVPALVRVADVVWCAAGMSGLYRKSVIAPPTSVYSLPLKLVDLVGGWDVDSDAIGEDLHMFIKCFFALNGHLTCRTIWSPVSQSNITSGSAGGIRGFFADTRARYKQALRHMWGALDAGYAIRKYAQMWREKRQTSKAYKPLHMNSGEGSTFYFTGNDNHDGNIRPPSAGGIFSDITQITLKEPHWERMFYMAHRIFEAHFLPIHMTILVIASVLYLWVTDGKHDDVSWTFTISDVLRAWGFMCAVIYLFIYESMHRVCVKAREREMKRAGLSEGMCFSYRTLKKNFADYLMIPVIAPLYGAIPLAQAELSHFWSIDLVYTVSKKVTRLRAKSITGDEMA